MNALLPTALLLPANQPPQFYQGGEAIAAFRGEQAPSAFRPEDWVASTTTQFGKEVSGLTTLPDGRLLADAVGAELAGWLGEEHVQRFGDSTALLVKLLDAGQRLPVHCHPSDTFAREHFQSHFGKTEAWIVVGTRGARPRVHVGFRSDVGTETVARWVDEQDAAAMLGALNEVDVFPGDTVFIPAGLPHAIGEDVFIVELQQPTDLSLTLEWQGFLDRAEQGHLGIGFDRALAALDRSGWDSGRLATLIRRNSGPSMLAPGADAFFRANRIGAGTAMPAGFTVLVGLAGSGTLRCGDGTVLEFGRGSTAVLPHAAGGFELDGDVTAIACRPPG